MKTLNKLFIAALATTAMTACNNDLNNNSLNSNRTVNFTMGIGETVSSRISMNDGEYTAKFSPNNSVGIFVKDQGSYKNLEYTTTDGTTWDGPQINLTEGGTYTYYAYYPYSSEVNAADAIAINVATDQETGGYLANDYLYCNKQSAETNVALEYKHALSLVDVTLAGDAIGENATVSIINVATDATLDVTAPSVTTGSTLGDVKMDVLTNTKNFRAIIPAQTIAASTPIFRIENEGRTYEAKYSGEISFAEGKYLALTITIGEAGGEPTINITTSGSINDWGEGSSAGGAEITRVLTDLIPLKLNEINTSDFKNLTLDPKIDEHENSFWFSLNKVTENTTSYSCTTDETYGNIITIDYKVAGTSWYNNCVGYYNPNKSNIIEPEKIYTLSFKAKADIVEGAEKSPSLWTCIKMVKENIFCAIETATVNDFEDKVNNLTVKTFTLTADWTEYNFNFKFSLFGDKSGAGSQSTTYKTWEMISTYDYYINLAPRDQDTKYYITDVKLIEKE